MIIVLTNWFFQEFMEEKKSMDYHDTNNVLELEKALEYTTIGLTKFYASICDVRVPSENASGGLFLDSIDR